MSFLHRCTVIFLIGCSACSPYASKRVPIENAIYMSGDSAPAQSKNINTGQPLLCGPDAPCLGPNEPLLIHDSFNNVPVQTPEKVEPKPKAKGVQKLKASQKKKTTHQSRVRKTKSSRDPAVKVAKNTDKKNPHGVVLSEDLNKTAASETPASETVASEIPASEEASKAEASETAAPVSDNFIPLSEVPNKVYTDEQRKEMYQDKEAKQSEINNKASQLSGPEAPDLNVKSESPTQVPEPAVPVKPESSTQVSEPAVPVKSSEDSAPSAQDTDKLLTQLIGNPAQRQGSPTSEEQKEKPSSKTVESSGTGVSDAELADIKIPPEAITNITE